MKLSLPFTFFLLLLFAGLAALLVGSPAQARPLAQEATVTLTPTLTGTATLTPTPTITRTVTPLGTLPAPQFTGTPTRLVPLSGAGDPPASDWLGSGVWLSLWIVGLLLVAFGLRTRIERR